MRMDDGEQYELAMTLHHETGETRVFRPILSEEERARRFQIFKEAVALFLDRVEQDRAGGRRTLEGGD